MVAPGRVLCLECRVSCVRVPPETARKSDCLGCAVLLCLVCLTSLPSFLKHDCTCLYVYTMLISHQEIHSLGSRDDIEESSGGQGGDDLQEQDGEEGEAEADGTREESQNQAGDNTTGKHIVQCTWWVWSCTCIHGWKGLRDFA